MGRIIPVAVRISRSIYTTSLQFNSYSLWRHSAMKTAPLFSTKCGVQLSWSLLFLFLTHEYIHLFMEYNKFKFIYK